MVPVRSEGDPNDVTTFHVQFYGRNENATSPSQNRPIKLVRRDIAILLRGCHGVDRGIIIFLFFLGHFRLNFNFSFVQISDSSKMSECRLFEIVARASRGQGVCWRTVVVTFSPRFVLINRTGMPMEYLQVT